MIKLKNILSESIEHLKGQKPIKVKAKANEIIIREYTPSDPADIDKAVREIEKLGVRNPINPKEIVIDDTVFIEISNWDKRLWFSSLHSLERGKGNASKVMQKIVDIADKYKVTIALDPVPFGTGDGRLKLPQLVNFYKKFGFEFEDGEDFGDMERIAEITAKMYKNQSAVGEKVNNMIKLTKILSELQSNDTYYIDKAIMIPRLKVQKFFEKNIEKIKELVDSNEYDMLYQLSLKEFPNISPEKVVQAINNELLATKWLTKEPTLKYPKKYSSFEITFDSDSWQIDFEVSKWMKKNKTKLTKLSNNNEYNKFYSLAKKAFPNAQEEKLMVAVQAAAVEHGIHYELTTD